MGNNLGFAYFFTELMSSIKFSLFTLQSMIILTVKIHFLTKILQTWSLGDLTSLDCM